VDDAMDTRQNVLFFLQNKHFFSLSRLWVNDLNLAYFPPSHQDPFARNNRKILDFDFFPGWEKINRETNTHSTPEQFFQTDTQKNQQREKTPIPDLFVD